MKIFNRLVLLLAFSAKSRGRKRRPWNQRSLDKETGRTGLPGDGIMGTRRILDEARVPFWRLLLLDHSHQSLCLNQCWRTAQYLFDGRGRHQEVLFGVVRLAHYPHVFQQGVEINRPADAKCPVSKYAVVMRVPAGIQ